MMKDSSRMAHASAALGLIVVATISLIFDVATRPQKPVMAYVMPVSVWEFTDNTAMNHFAALKLRGCSRVPDSERGVAIIGGEKVEGLYVEYVDDDTPDSTFPKGSFYVGAIRWTIDEDIDRLNKIGFRMLHDCGLNDVESEFWYEVPEKDDRLIIQE